ncbi:hypothetical protein EKH77_12670 [Streptomyces luteoverticillatus]|uniref:Uncharacterized protein n=1 Tax=Streptomyces luteoverticillatus TaxID=66425 RepID=A0A3S9PHU6_STRLT|nr:hypothetical protein EKH77_12670 [Streptomyces luteoverticillatus]
MILVHAPTLPTRRHQSATQAPSRPAARASPSGGHRRRCRRRRCCRGPISSAPRRAPRDGRAGSSSHAEGPAPRRPPGGARPARGAP